MPGEKCARCGKTVYVVEKLACLDQTWHKWCFNCDTCHATLTMKNYQAIGGKVRRDGGSPRTQACLL
jgi:LIM domain